MIEYLAKINVLSGDVAIEHSVGLSGVSASAVDDNKVCRIAHPSFTESGTFAFPVLIEKQNVQATMTAITSDGICDVTCYDADEARQDVFHFQILIRVVGLEQG